MIRHQWLSWSVAIGTMAALSVDAAPSVNVGMNAAFCAGPYLLELLETAAGENSTSYFPLLDRIAGGYFAEVSSDADLYNTFLALLEHDGHISSPDALSTFNLALSLRSSAPRIEAHYQYYSTAVEPSLDRSVMSECETWVLLDGNQYCAPDMLHSVKKGLFNSQIKTLPFDRTLGSGREAILYADPTSAKFGAFHRKLFAEAQAGALSYRVRYRGALNSAPNLPVSGYGVELALKRTDYIVIDDREASQPETQAPMGSEAILDDDAEDMTDLQPLSTSELSGLGMKAASFILQSENPFETVVKLTQDFPKYSRSIAAQEISEEFATQHEDNLSRLMRGGANHLWINGVRLIERQIEPFALIEMMRRERSLIDSIRGLGFNGKQSVSLLGHEKISSAKSEDDAPRYDWTDRSEDGRAIIWLNDLESDERYNDYPKDLASLLQPTYPGQMPPIAKNIFNLVAPVNVENADDVSFLSQIVSLMKRGIPVRMGLVPVGSSADSASHIKNLYFLAENYGSDALIEYVKTYQTDESHGSIEEHFSNIIENQDLLPDGEKKSFSDVVGLEDGEERLKLSRRWTKRLNADSTTRLAFLNGLVIPRDKNWMQMMSSRIGEDLQMIQKAVYHGVLDDNSWVPGQFLEVAAPSRNAYITVEDDKALRILDVSKLYGQHSEIFNQAAVLESYEESTKETWAAVTLISDLLTLEGLDLVVSALAFKRNNPGVRLDIVHNPTQGAKKLDIGGILKANQMALGDLETVEQLKSLIESAIESPEYESHNARLSSFLSYTGVQAGTQTIIVNGRVVGPITSEAPFDVDNFQQLLDFEQRVRILPVYAALDDLGVGDKLSGALAAAKLTSLVSRSTMSDLPEGIFDSGPSVRSTIYDSLQSEHTSIKLGDPGQSSIHITALFDPVSEQGQRWAPILKVLSELSGVYIQLVLNPKQKIAELPIKRFFRYVMDSKPIFNESGKVDAPKAVFRGLPSEALLTASMDVPPAWLVAPRLSTHDLDNIKLSSVRNDVNATYELEHILIEGHSREGRSAPPRGAQLVLGTESNPLVTDTIIMANLGFFQFKANPGFYNIRLKDGRSAEIFEIESIGAKGYEAVPGDEGNELSLMDFTGTTLYPRLKRQVGMDEIDVLEETEGNHDDDGLVAKGRKFAGSLFGTGSAKGKSLSAKEHADINIFSVASGHLYERMLNIMMVSVMRHTKHTVKFWFIEQFLSPSFKEFIPHLAEQYGFKYEMVTYKWPHWLRQQKEKQREIWGYKILFLDVLFPLSLDKVIFVDADQIVRTDMIDLVNYDLEGAPYGFTPMCDSRTEMEGFRFWKQGYWSSYLRGRPYHISALYVVDLRRFRELAAGDRLRQQYHALSADPNSLSNLDQDLPNHMQFQIPIQSLPQEWLWCETWCSDESLAEARTIDLCNNPQTKEPKLDRARRQVPEWTTYDDEIAALDKKRREQAADESHDKSTSTDGVNTKSRRFEEEKDEL